MVMVPMHSFSNSREQRGPASPYPTAHTSTTLLQSPAYPSPAQSDTEPSRHLADGLGLYAYSQPFPTSADRMMFSPAPHSNQAWNGPSSIAPAPIVNPWTSGAYDHPVCPDNSNMLWPEYHPSHRSSVSSRRAMSVFSGDGSEHSYPSIKMEGGVEWATDNDISPLATVAPDRLINSTSYGGAYGSPRSVYESDSTSDPTYKIEPTSDFSPKYSPSIRPRSSHSDGKVTEPRRRQQRRTKVPADQAKFQCEVCGTGFVRAYNKKTHMARHNPNRCKEHFCEQCDMKFERKTDLVRHINSVHLRLKEHECDLCGKKFARRDTLNRHDSQGSCPRRNEVDLPALIARGRPLQSSPGNAMSSYLPSPQPEMYAGFQPAETSHGQYSARGQQRTQAGSLDGGFPHFPSRGYGHEHNGL